LSPCLFNLYAELAAAAAAAAAATTTTKISKTARWNKVH